MNNKNMNTTSPKYNGLMLFYIEIAYWAAYYMKWKSEKEIPFISGIGYTMLMVFCHIMTILMIVHLYTAYSVIDSLPSLSSDGVFTAKDKLIWTFRLLPVILFIEFLLMRMIYKKTSKKELLRYFQTMPPLRQARGKVMFIAYSLFSLILVFVFGVQVTNKRESLQENDNSRVSQERIELIQQQLRQIDSTTQNELYLQ